jgi:hypothetical protein
MSSRLSRTYLINPCSRSVSASAGVSYDECHPHQDTIITPRQYKISSVALRIPALVVTVKQNSWVCSLKTEKFNYVWFDITVAIRQ